MQQPEQTASPQKTADAVAAVRGLCALLNTAMIYETTHPVFRRAAEQQIMALDKALKAGAMTLTFTEGQVRWGTFPLEPGSSLFQKLSRDFDSKGVKGLLFQPGITADEMVAFVTLFAKKGEIEAQGLTQALDKAGIHHIKEQKVKFGIVGKENVVTPKAPAAPPPTPSATQPLPPRKPAPPPSTTLSWDIEEGIDEVATEEVFKGFEPPPGTPKERPPIREFVAGVFEAVAHSETSPEQAAELIADDFEERLNEKVAEVEQQSAVKVQRLERVQAALLMELESLHLAAIVMDAKLIIIAANNPARKLIGAATEIDPASPLGRFIDSGKERQAIQIGGVARLAHIIIAKSPDHTDGAMLVCLE